MPVDVSALSPESRKIYLGLGRRVTTPNALAQANKTLGAFVLYGAEVTEEGYGPDDDSHLSDTRDTLIERYTDRSDAKGASKVAKVNYLKAVREAKQDRLGARNLLTSCVLPLRDGGNLSDAQRIQSLLDDTSAAPDDTTLLDHMKRMHATLIEPVLVPLIAGRGGPGLTVRLETSRDKLLAAIRERAAHPEVSALSDERDILDGIIVSLTRNAARAARVAARRLGQPAIAKEFELVYFRSTRSIPADGDEPTPVTE